MPGDVKFQARVAPLVLAHPRASFDLQIPVRFPTKGRFFGPFLGLIGVRLHSKTSSFLAFENTKSFVCTRSVGSFRKNNIFLAFPRLFPPFRVPFAYRCRRRLPALSCDNSNRLPQAGGRVKSKVRRSFLIFLSVRCDPPYSTQYRECGTSFPMFSADLGRRASLVKIKAFPLASSTWEVARGRSKSG